MQLASDAVADSPRLSANRAGRSLVEIRNVTKVFGATQALRGVTFEIRPGETLGLLGANGAGKSTLIKTLSGIHPPTSGEIVVEGHVRRFSYPSDARNAGIATVHQNIDDGVVFGMSVAENLLLDEIAAPGSPALLDRRQILKRARTVQQKLDLDLPLTIPVEDLTPSRRQEVAIARELVKEPVLLIFDEPTSTLSEHEASKLFDAIRELQQRGITILYISHRMSEIELLCDRVVILRNGSIVYEGERPLDKRTIAGAILGELVIETRHESRSGRDVGFEAKGMRVRPSAPSFDLAFRRGEIVGLTGLIGAGKTELLDQIAGHRALVSGEMVLDGVPYRPRDVSDAMTTGVVIVPEERAQQAIFPGERIWNHCTVGLLNAFSRAGFMRTRREVAFTRDVIRDFKVVCPGSDAEIEELSGGNQQKLLVGRWLKRNWKLLILDEPFRGIDIGARALISLALREYSEVAPVVVCSSDPEEVIEVADRVLIMVDGDIVHEDLANALNAESLAEIVAASARSETDAFEQERKE